MPEKLTTEKFIEKARKVHGDRYDYSDVVYLGSKIKVKIRCSVCGCVFEQKPNSHLCGSGCPSCAHKLVGVRSRLTTESFVSKALAVHGDKYDYSLVDYCGCNDCVTIRCKTCGTLFDQKPSNHLSGHGCPVCAANKRGRGRRSSYTNESFISKARSVHGDLYDYSNVVYRGTHKDVEIICRKHGSFFQTPHNHLHGNGCPKCGHERRVNGTVPGFGIRTSNTEEFIAKAKLVHGDRYDYSRVDYVRSSEHVLIGCKIHGFFKQTPGHHLQGCGCPKCAFDSVDSVSESELRDKLYELFGKDDVIVHYEGDARYPFVCDFYIKSRDLFVELNGFVTHGRHFFDENSNVDRYRLFVLQEKLRSYRNKGPSKYKAMIDTWTVSDVEKRRVAKLNSLNYVVFWDCKLRDFRRWVELGCPDGRDYIKEYSWMFGY